MNGRNNKEGVVEVCEQGHWVKICNDEWTNREAKVVCRQLGFLQHNSSNAANTDYRLRISHTLSGPCNSLYKRLHEYIYLVCTL